MALNLATMTSLPLQISSFFNKLKSKAAGSSASNSDSLSAGYRQLYLQIVAFILFAALSFWVINQVRVNGPVYNTLKEYQNLTADALPPPLYRWMLLRSITKPMSLLPILITKNVISAGQCR